MAKYRKKPVVIEAIKWVPCEETKKELMHLGLDPFTTNKQMAVMIKTLGGYLFANPGDYIIKRKDIAGEFYPCKPDIFEKTYEIVEE